jgi:hypothetical protein
VLAAPPVAWLLGRAGGGCQAPPPQPPAATNCDFDFASSGLRRRVNGCSIIWVWSSVHVPDLMTRTYAATWLTADGQVCFVYSEPPAVNSSPQCLKTAVSMYHISVSFTVSGNGRFSSHVDVVLTLLLCVPAAYLLN